MIKVNTMIAVMEMDEDELRILNVDRGDVSISISTRKEERPNFLSPIPPPPYLGWSGKMEINEFILFHFPIDHTDQHGAGPGESVIPYPYPHWGSDTSASPSAYDGSREREVIKCLVKDSSIT